MSLQVNMFDPKFVGYSFPTKTVKVEEGKLRFFSKTIGDDVVDEISRLIQMIPEGVRKAEEEK